MKIPSNATDGCQGPAALFALMAEQLGVASTTQARALGVSRAVERRLQREGALAEALPGVLAAGGVRLSFPATAMAAALRPGVIAVSHGTAARLHRLAGFADHRGLDVVGERGAHLSAKLPVTRHYSRGPVREHVGRIGPIPVTSLPLTLALIAPTTSRATLIGALADALGRGVPAAAIRSVAQQWQEPGRSGPGLLLDLLDELAARTRVA
ncbi:type IV toxin-antitoxin system AbiEi family antitoxin domain-containing protein [Desertimonas flava]|uniref:type IV toxin-antitoxin system AbiEi family antitoxin domain-containing protein n=1 Tax=Desertimonas flava TaxID=2064846 RepID=UPI001D0C1962|nr:type IV toxin-antitoxin system AbiEi family antitoxin domain-containing protein [Desertimonas flava]